MLSRVADSLFWMSRYVERAECVARIVEVNQQLMMDLPLQQATQIEKNWHPLVACLGEEDTFKTGKRKVTAESVVEFLVFDRSHPSSIVGGLAAARENARTVREQIPTEMWEQINRTYLWLISKTARQYFERNNYDFFQRVKKSLQLFQGITDSVMMHNEGWEFIQMGRSLERADKTSRLLDDAFFLVQDKQHPASSIAQWIAILRCCNARQTYQRLYASVVDPMKVADLLLYHGEFPRAVEFCVRELDHSLRRISGVAPGRYSNRAEKLSGRLISELSFGSIEDIWARGLHDAMDDLQSKLNEIGAAMMEAYIHPTTTPEVALAALSAQAIVPQ